MYLFDKFRRRFGSGQPRYLLFKGLVNCHLCRVRVADAFPDLREILSVLSSDSRTLSDRFGSVRWRFFFSVLLFNHLLEREDAFIVKLSALGPRDINLLYFEGIWRRILYNSKMSFVNMKTSKLFFAGYLKRFSRLVRRNLSVFMQK